jgi:hypothetical protein
MQHGMHNEFSSSFSSFNAEKMTAASTGLHTQQLKISKRFQFLLIIDILIDSCLL